MLSLPLPFTTARLDFAPPFAFLPSFLRILVCVALLVGSVLVVVKLYRVELRRVPTRVARVLLGLRVAAVAAILLLVAASPAVVRVTKQAARGRVVLAVDASESMSVTDPERPLLEKLRLARALNLHDGVASDDHLGGWIDDIANRGIPHFPPPDTDAGVARRGMFDEVIVRANAITRHKVAGGLAEAIRPRLEAIHAVESVRFGGTHTDLKVPLDRAAEGRGDPPAAVVILTDGRHNAGQPPLAAARTLAAKGVPVFAVNVAPRDPPTDVAVVSVAAAVTTVCRGSCVPVEVRVRASAWPAGPIGVSLKFADDQPPLSRTVTHTGGGRDFDLTFHPKLDQLGLASLTAIVTTATPDRLPANNARVARVNVVDAKPRVLLVDGEARWEHHYLHAALSRSTDPPLDLKTVLFRQPRLDYPAESTELPALKLPPELDDFECIVLGDATPDQLPPKDRDRLRKYVSDGGGTLIVVAGKRAMPLAFADDESFRPLLPIKHPRVVSRDDGFRPSLTADGSRSWFLRLGDSPELSTTVWESFVPHHWGVVGEAKDGADVLATVAEPMVEERRSALVARHHYGFGRVLFVGLDSTWRWRFKTGDEHHHRFWKQTVQWAVAGRLLTTANADGTIRCGTRESVYRANQDVGFVLRAGEKLPRPGEAAGKLIRLPDTPAGSFPLAESERDYIATFRNLAPGRYAVEPEVKEWADQLRTPTGRLRATFEVLPPESDEMCDLSANVPLLEELARVGGGRVFDAAGAHDLVDEIAARVTTRAVEKSTPMRRSWWSLVVVLLLLTAEWVIRKWAGLA